MKCLEIVALIHFLGGSLATTTDPLQSGCDDKPRLKHEVVHKVHHNIRRRLEDDGRRKRMRSHKINSSVEPANLQFVFPPISAYGTTTTVVDNKTSINEAKSNKANKTNKTKANKKSGKSKTAKKKPITYPREPSSKSNKPSDDFYPTLYPTLYPTRSPRSWQCSRKDQAKCCVKVAQNANDANKYCRNLGCKRKKCRRKGGNKCTPTDKAKCCREVAINGKNANDYCKDLGCSWRKCK